MQRNAKVYIASRNKEKADKAIASLKEATGNEPLFIELDHADLSSVKKAAEEFLNKEPELHILFNNHNSSVTLYRTWCANRLVVETSANEAILCH